MPRSLRLMLWGLLLSVGISGCVGRPPQLYRLQADVPVPAAEVAGQGPAVLLGPLTLADYLQRSQVVQRTPDGGLWLNGGAEWAGSLQDDVSNLLLRQLAAELQSSRLVMFPGANFHPEAQAVINISRLDAGPMQEAVLEAEWRVLDSRGIQQTQVVRLEAPHDGSQQGQVRAQAQLVSLLGQQLARVIEPLVQAQRRAQAQAKAEAEAKAKAQAKAKAVVTKGRQAVRRPSKPKPKPEPPEVEPIGPEADVFRF